MMKLRLICFGLFFNYLICHTYAQFTCNSIEGYDTKDLTRPSQWQVTTDYQCLSNLAGDCTFNIAFCQPAPACFREYSACENVTGATNMTIIGGVTPNLFRPYESGKKGFYAQFPKGPSQNISNTTICEPSLIVQFYCNLKAKWFIPLDDGTALAPQPIDIDIDDKDPCLTIMKFEYAGACLNGKEEPKGISGGAVFLIILFSFALAYFLVGVGYNGLVKHKSGINLLPQAQFWIGLPLHAIEGCRATISCCSATPRPSQATYESV